MFRHLCRINTKQVEDSHIIDICVVHMTFCNQLWTANNPYTSWIEFLFPNSESKIWKLGYFLR